MKEQNIFIYSTEIVLLGQPLPPPLFEFNMFNSKILLKYIILLGVWSFILIMIVRYVFKSASKTSTTATTSIISIPKDRVLPNEVLIDKRTGK